MQRALDASFPLVARWAGALHKQPLPEIGTQMIAVRFFDGKKS